MEDREKCFNFMINRIMRIAKSATSRIEKLQKICNEMKDNISYYDWVGFYIADESEQELTLGPFSGEPTEHTNILFGKGICGQAAERKETFVIQDITKETNYLSCSSNVKSEIVVPILKNEKVIGELDIDSHTISPFNDEDRKFLEQVCNTVAQLF